MQKMEEGRGAISALDLLTAIVVHSSTAALGVQSAAGLRDMMCVSSLCPCVMCSSTEKNNTLLSGEKKERRAHPFCVRQRVEGIY